MPDWVTHLGTTYLATQAAVKSGPGLTRWLGVRHVLLGSILPDVTRFTIILVDILDWPAIPVFTYFIPFHSVLIVSLLAGAIALLIPLQGQGSGHAFGLIMAGAVFHFVLDEFDGLVGCGSTIFYPLYFGSLTSGWDAEGHLATLLLIGSAIAVGVALSQRRGWPKLIFRITRRRVTAALALILMAIILPFFFQGWMVDRNAYYLDFITNPTAYEGTTVELCYSEVIATDPLTVEEFDRALVIQIPSVLNAGDWLSLRGVYQNGVIQVTTLVIHRSFSDLMVSLAAAGAFVFLMVDRTTFKDIGRQLKGDPHSSHTKQLEP